MALFMASVLDILFFLLCFLIYDLLKGLYDDGLLWEFVKAVIAYQKKLDSTTSVPRPLKLDQAMEKKRKVIIKSFSLARNIYTTGQKMNPSKESELQPGAEFLESNTALSIEQENRLKQMGATVRNAGSYIERLRMNEEREKMAENVMGKMSVEQLSDLLSSTI
uniref:Uncharacterized protein n=1 Tax=Salix viminalis TaxID=40686 RepID=A0A6N2KW91_SALVM